MQWKKLGVVWKPEGQQPWARSHAMIPTPVRIDNECLRIFLCSRDAENRARPGFVDVSAADPTKVLYVHPDPLMDIGAPGTFDDAGVLPTSIVPLPDGRMYMYYAGFELGHLIRYRLLTGLAVSNDGGVTFHRVRKTPVLERSDAELYFRCGPYVAYVPESSRFRLWYVAGSAWEEIDGKSMPVYDLRYLESDDGIAWDDEGRVVLSIERPDEHGFGRPWLVVGEHGYQLYYSIRRRSLRAYRMGYAESQDGLTWSRKDEELNLDVSAQGWDSEAIMYAAVIEVNGRTFLFYNGNDFGATGFGVAEQVG